MLRAGAGIEHAIIAVADQYITDPEIADKNRRRLHHALLEHLFNPDLPSAIRYDDAMGAVLQLFCKRGAPEEDLALIIQRCSPASINYTNEHAATPLAEYLKSRSPKASVVKTLLDAGATTLVYEGDTGRSILDIFLDRKDDIEIQAIEALLQSHDPAGRTGPLVSAGPLAT